MEEFKAGDRVRLIHNPGFNALEPGAEGVVSETVSLGGAGPSRMGWVEFEGQDARDQINGPRSTFALYAHEVELVSVPEEVAA